MISESSMKAAKRSRNRYPYSTSEYYNPCTGEYETDVNFTVLPDGPHAPNKFEAKALRRICSQTGLTPEQVREHKKYRQELAKAAKSASQERGFRSFSERFYVKNAIRLRKQISTQTGMSPFHPMFIHIFEAQWKNIHNGTMKAKTALELSLQK